MVEEAEGLGEKRELGHFPRIEEKMDGVGVEAQREGLEEGYVIGHEFIIAAVETVCDQLV